ncbi:MAG: tetratricopeptide repeat protein [Rhodospirillaceae bacterium]|nr:tetratricopeptide repeat protein [Rhodospirillaceae bacterium]
MKRKLATAHRHRLAGRLKEALALYGQVLEGDPENLDALRNLARMSLDLSEPQAAASMVLQALSKAPQERESLEILDAVLTRLETPQAQAQLIFEYAQLLKGKGLWDTALVFYRRALQFDPTLVARDTFDSIPLLAQGHLQQGWLAFEWRNTIGSLGPFTEKVWNGEGLTGKTVLVWGEQGIGDQIMFSTCLPDIIEQAGHVIIGIDERLVSLFERSFPQASVYGVTRYTADGQTVVQDFSWLDNYPAVDFFVLEGSLPRFFRPTIESFPTRSNKLIADTQQVESWCHRMEGLGSGKKIGISWRSLYVNEDRADHFPALELWRPLFDRPDTHFISLQAGMTQQEQLLFKERFGLEIIVFDDLDLNDDLDGTAAVISALHGVVTTQNYLQWLSPALAVPTWVISKGSRDMQWGLLGEKHYPWFPALNVCIEDEDDRLEKVFARVAAEI